jgi:demethylmenaquinone methyltransferase/2-methoxy-6-polyprenyl-1,4-benzoquinol methylase
MQSNNFNTVTTVVPDETSNLSKKAQVADMFNNIAGKYDFLNHFLSLGIDKSWRRKAIAAISVIRPKVILDVATGTGDLAIEASKLSPEKIIGIDIAIQMLNVGRQKLQEANLSGIITLETGDSEVLRFDNNYFDAITCAYGVRNFDNVSKGLSEMYRVIRFGGKLAILEFSHPARFPIKQGYQLYFKYILPLLGKIVSKHSKAYTYLPESVKAFPEGKQFCRMLEDVGFKNVKANPLTFGITTLYTADK